MSHSSVRKSGRHNHICRPLVYLLGPRINIQMYPSALESRANKQTRAGFMDHGVRMQSTAAGPSRRNHRGWEGSLGGPTGCRRTSGDEFRACTCPVPTGQILQRPMRRIRLVVPVKTRHMVARLHPQSHACHPAVPPGRHSPAPPRPCCLPGAPRDLPSAGGRCELVKILSLDPPFSRIS